MNKSILIIFISTLSILCVTGMFDEKVRNQIEALNKNLEDTERRLSNNINTVHSSIYILDANIKLVKKELEQKLSSLQSSLDSNNQKLREQLREETHVAELLRHLPLPDPNGGMILSDGQMALSRALVDHLAKGPHLYEWLYASGQTHLPSGIFDHLIETLGKFDNRGSISFILIDTHGRGEPWPAKFPKQIKHYWKIGERERMNYLREGCSVSEKTTYKVDWAKDLSVGARNVLSAMDPRKCSLFLYHGITDVGPSQYHLKLYHDESEKFQRFKALTVEKIELLDEKMDGFKSISNSS